MATKKNKGDRHKPARTTRIPKALAERLDVLAERNVTSATQEAIRAIREYLERHDLWPPPRGGSAD